MSACILVKPNNGNGYRKVGKKYAHRMALEAVCPPPGPGYQAAHGPCHNRACVNPDHLTWKTVAENSADRHRDGTVNHGEVNGQAKLTAEDVLAIRSERRAGVPRKALASMFNVTPGNITHIVQRRTWTHI